MVADAGVGLEGGVGLLGGLVLSESLPDGGAERGVGVVELGLDDPGDPDS